MQPTFHDRYRDTSLAAQAWKLATSPSFAGMLMLLLAAGLVGAAIDGSPAWTVFCRAVVVPALASVAAMLIEWFRRPQRSGQRASMVGIVPTYVLPRFRDEFSHPPTLASRAAAGLPALLFALVAAAPILVSLVALTDATQAGRVEVNSGESADFFVMRGANDGVRVQTAAGLTLTAATEPNDQATLLVQSVHDATTRQTVELKADERLNFGGRYYSLAAKRIDPRRITATFTSTDTSETLALAPEQAGELAGTTIELLRIADDYFGVGGPAVTVRTTDAEGTEQVATWFLEHPGFPERHGAESGNVSFGGLNWAQTAVLNVRDTPGIRWGLFAAILLALIGVAALLVWRFGRVVLVGVSGDYVTIGGAVPLAIAVPAEDSVTALDKALLRGTTPRSSQTDSPDEPTKGGG